MARSARDRSRTIRGSISGSIVRTYPPNPAQFPTVTTNVTSLSLGAEYCSDWVGTPWIDTPFNKRRGVCPGVTLSGVRTQSGLVYTSNGVPLNNTPTLHFREPWNYSPYQRTPLSSASLAAMAIANMNPNRPDVDLPVSILELRELPQLLRDGLSILNAKGSPAHGSARALLVAQFGIAPIIRDLVSLFDFAKSVDQRETYLRELSRGSKRIKRKLHEEFWDGVSTGHVAFHSSADNLSASNKIDLRGTMSRKYWFTARASLLDPPPTRELRSLSSDIVLGINTISAQQLWNLVPWTWLLDWFTGTGTLLGAYRGGLKWQWSHLNVMYETDYKISGSFPSPRAGFDYSPQEPESHAVTKFRTQPSVSIYPQWRMPYLKASQWSILSSLAILKIL